MQTAINPALAAAMTLEQAAQVGDFIPVTKDGKTTVVGRNLQQALQPMMPQGIPQGMPGMQQMASMPGVRNAAQQAGLGGQIQAMQMQEAQKAIMNAAMQQAKPPAGIERLNPQMGNFAEGGIVGYAQGDLTEDEYDRRLREAERSGKFRQTILGGSRTRVPEGMGADERERLLEVIAATTPMMPIPEVEVPTAPPPSATGAQRPAPTGGGDANLMKGIAATLGERARAEAASMQGPATPEQILEREKRNRAAFDQFLISQGIKPDAFKQREEEDRLLMQQQRDLLRERMQREEGKDTFLSRAGAALRGFSQMKGQGVGGALMGAHENLARQVQAGEIRMDQFRDMEMRLNELEITRRRALDDAKRATAEGRWKDAQQSLDTERAAANEIKKIQIGTYMPQAQAQIEEAKVAEMGRGRAEAAAQRKLGEQDRTMLAAQGRLTEAEKARAQVAEKNKAMLALPKDSKDPTTRQMRENAENEIRQAEENLAAARALYNRLVNQTLQGAGISGLPGVAPSAPPKGAVRQIG